MRKTVKEIKLKYSHTIEFIRVLELNHGVDLAKRKPQLSRAAISYILWRFNNMPIRSIGILSRSKPRNTFRLIRNAKDWLEIEDVKFTVLYHEYLEIYISSTKAFLNKNRRIAS
jgi:hypothetical protein